MANMPRDVARDVARDEIDDALREVLRHDRDHPDTTKAHPADVLDFTRSQMEAADTRKVRTLARRARLGYLMNVIGGAILTGLVAIGFTWPAGEWLKWLFRKWLP